MHFGSLLTSKWHKGSIIINMDWGQTPWGFVLIVHHFILNVSINTTNAPIYWLEVRHLPSKILWLYRLHALFGSVSQLKRNLKRLLNVTTERHKNMTDLTLLPHSCTTLVFPLIIWATFTGCALQWGVRYCQIWNVKWNVKLDSCRIKTIKLNDKVCSKRVSGGEKAIKSKINQNYHQCIAFHKSIQHCFSTW